MARGAVHPKRHRLPKQEQVSVRRAKRDLMFDDLIKICKLHDDGFFNHEVARRLGFSLKTIQTYVRIYKESGFDAFYIAKTGRVWKSKDAYLKWKKTADNTVVKTEKAEFYKPMILEALSYWSQIGGPHEAYWTKQMDAVNKGKVPEVASNTNSEVEQQWTKRMETLTKHGRHPNTVRLTHTKLPNGAGLI